MTDRLITLATYRFAPQADLARMILEQEGIPAFIADSNIVTADWFLGGAIGYVKLQVAASHAEAALTILQNNPQLLDTGSRNDTEAEDHMTCLACGERMSDDAHQCKACGWSYESEVIDDEDA
jgi:Putative prokaryotic signal transducing protein